MTWWITATAAGTPIAAGTLVLLHTRRRYVAVTVRGPSMSPTLIDGEQILVRRTGIHGIRHGDIVVLRSPSPSQYPGFVKMVTGEAGPETWVVKRARALPGDPLPPEVAEATGQPAGSAVPNGRLIVLGDNADMSFDSRTYGFINANNLLGTMHRRLGGR